jgi:hypothetical protein
MLALRLSKEDKDALDELVRRRADRLAAEGVAVTASSVIRSLIRQAVKEERIELGTTRTGRKHAG